LSETKKQEQPITEMSAQNNPDSGETVDEVQTSRSMSQPENLSEPLSHQTGEIHTTPADGLGSICETLRELKAQRNDLVRIQVALTNRVKAVCRRFVDVKGKNDKAGLKRADDLYRELCAIHKNPGGHENNVNHPAVAANQEGLGGQENNAAQYTVAAKAHLWCKPMFQARDTITCSEKRLRADMTKLAAKLPVCSWVDTVKGFGHTNLACIIGETGDLSLYANPAKLWKRLGLAVINGQRQRKTLDKELAIEMGYSPTRRSAVWTLGDCLIKGQGKGEDAGEFRRIYDARKAYELERNEKMTKAHAHNRAKRLMEKEAVRKLWKAWRALSKKGNAA
jgi:hypothetical protein